jgi:hypothetical protein
MRRRRTGVRGRVPAAAVIAAAVAPAAACSASAQPGTSASPTGSVATRSRWGKVTAIPGLAGLNAGGNASIDSVWCSSAGNCLAGGGYTTGNGSKPQAFLASERSGRWHAATAVPGLVGPNPAGHAMINGHAAVYPVSPGVVSCASPGNCAVGGAAVASGASAAVVASVQGGQWQTAIEIPGTASLNAGGLPQVAALSCPSAGNCAVGGWYLDSSGNRHAFVADERNGRWQAAVKVPSPDLNVGEEGGG